jgi:hypothetical protein
MRGSSSAASPSSPPSSAVPWPVTLAQVAFGTLVVMLGVLYAFMAKGWLR